MFEKMQIFISIAATLIATLISIYQDVSLHTLAIRLIVVIVAFYVIGLAVRLYLANFVFVTPPETAVEDPEVDVTAADEEDAAGETTMFENFNGPQPMTQRSKYD